MSFKLYYFDSLASTQDKAKQFAKEGFENIAIVADEQTEGRGRFSRKWISPKGGLWISFLLRPKIDKIHHLTFLAATAAATAIRKTSGINAKIKWPNDIHYNNKKICGILTEGVFGNDKFVIVGMGIDVNQEEFPEDIKDTASSLKILTGKIYSLKNMAILLSNIFFELYSDYYIKEKFEDIREMWKKNCDTLGKEITAINRKKKCITGTAFDVDENCSLMIKTLSGKILKVVEGDVSVRY